MTMTAIQKQVTAWESTFLTSTGHYRGMLSFDGYRFGDYVPVTVRYSAMLAHRWASRAAEMASSRQREVSP